VLDLIGELETASGSLKKYIWLRGVDMRIDDLKIDFPCPECQEKFQVTLYQLLRGGVVVCPRCRATNAEAELEKLEDDLRIWNRSLQNLKKCLNHNFGLYG